MSSSYEPEQRAATEIAGGGIAPPPTTPGATSVPINEHNNPTDDGTDLPGEVQARITQIINDWTGYAKAQIEEFAAEATSALISALEEFQETLGTETDEEAVAPEEVPSDGESESEE